MFCNKCGASLKDGAKFCNICGNKLSIPVATPVQEQIQPEVTEAAAVVQEQIQPEAAEVMEAVQEQVQPEAAEVMETVQEQVEPEAAEIMETVQEQVEPEAAEVMETVQEQVQPEAVEMIETVPQQYVPQQVQMEAAEIPEAQFGQPADQMPIQYVPPVQNGYQQPGYVQPEAAPRKKSRGNEPWKLILTGFLGILLTVAMVGFIIHTSFTMNINEDTMDKILKETEVSDIVLNNDNGKEVDLVDFVEDKLEFKIEDIFDMTDEELRQVLNTEVVTKFLQDNFGNYFKYIINGGSVPESISKETILKFVEEHKDEIYEQFQVEGENILAKEDLDNFEKNHGEDLDRLFETAGYDNEVSIDWIEDQVGLDFRIISSLISTLKWIIIGAMAFLVLLILVINLRKISQGLDGISIASIFAGVITAGFAGTVMFISEYSTSNLVNIIVQPTVMTLLIFGLSFLGGGIVLLIIAGIIKKIQSKRRA